MSVGDPGRGGIIGLARAEGSPRPRVLELFAGIGGCAAALSGHAEVVCAVDQDADAHATYTRNHPHPARRWNVASLRPERLAAFEADLWWASPPCQPFTVRGQRRDVDDPRCRAFNRMVELIDAVRPRHVALENVPGFEGSRAHGRLRETLQRHSYHVAERLLCPGQLGVPNKRLRFYLIASLDPLSAWRDVRRRPRPLVDYLDDEPDEALYVDDALLARYGDALPVTDLEHPEPQIHCVTSAYGRSPVYAGSYVRDGRGVRLLSPDEIVALLHFPRSFRFPPELPVRRRYKLAGNSLSVVAVREVLAPLMPRLVEAP